MQSVKQICERGTFFNVRYTKRVPLEDGDR